MPAAHIKPDAYTFKCFDAEPGKLEQMRLEHLSKLLRYKGDFGMEVAWNIFYKLVKSKQASTNHFNLMLAKGCYSSNEQQRLIDIDMPQAGVIPNATTYITFSKQLLIEGDVVSARNIVTKEMPAAGSKPNKFFWGALHEEPLRKQKKKERMTFKKLKKTRGDDKEWREKERERQRKKF